MAKRNSTRRPAARRPRAPANGAPVGSAKLSLRERIEQQIGETPIHDSLAAVTWMQRVLAVAAADVVDSDLDDNKKRSEMLKIADRMAKLRDIDRIHQAEQTLRGARAQQEEALPAPRRREEAAGHEGLQRPQAEGFRELAGGDPLGGFAAGGGPPTV